MAKQHEEEKMQEVRLAHINEEDLMAVTKNTMSKDEYMARNGVENNTEHWDDLTLEEAEILNSEVTPEIRALLWEMKKEKERDQREQDELQEMVTHTLETLNGPDTEKDVESVVELQDRMDKGMAMINECNEVLDRANKGQRLPYDVFMGWVNRRRRLWAHWHTLKNQCQEIAEKNPRVWPEYFKAQNPDVMVNKYFTYEDDKIYDSEDEERFLDSRMIDTVEAYFLSHIAENQE